MFKIRAGHRSRTISSPLARLLPPPSAVAGVRHRWVLGLGFGVGVWGREVGGAAGGEVAAGRGGGRGRRSLGSGFLGVGEAPMAGGPRGGRGGGGRTGGGGGGSAGGGGRGGAGAPPAGRGWIPGGRWPAAGARRRFGRVSSKATAGGGRTARRRELPARVEDGWAGEMAPAAVGGGEDEQWAVNGLEGNSPIHLPFDV